MPDGDYTFKSVTADVYDYNGTVDPPVPVIVVEYSGKEGDYTQVYPAGKGDYLQPSDDKTHFVHPDGESTPTLYKAGAAVKLLKSIVDAGYPHDKLAQNNHVNQFNGMVATMVNVAAPVGRSKDPAKEGKTIPVVAKIVTMPGAKAARSTNAPAGRSTTAGKSVAPSSAQSTTNGSLDDETVSRVATALAEANGNTLTRVKLGTLIWLQAQKAKDVNAHNYKKLVSDATWLEEHAEEGGWTVEGEAVTLA